MSATSLAAIPRPLPFATIRPLPMITMRSAIASTSASRCEAVSYTHLTLPTNREV